MKELALYLLLGLSTMGMEGQTVTERDRVFISEAAQANMLEVTLGELAQSNSSSIEIKKLGQHMIQDHAKSDNELKDLATKKGVVVPTNLNEEGFRTYHKLVKLQGKEFDKAYAKCRVKDHKKSILKYKKEADKGDDADLKVWANKTLPTLEQNKVLAEEICEAVKKKG